MGHLSWKLCNIYGFVFGWRVLAPVHRMIAHASLHALGYGNTLRERWGGEEWFVSRVLAPSRPALCMDIGANIGKYTRLLLRHTNATVYSVDPLPGSCASLRALGDRVKVIQAAVSDVEGEAPFFHRSDTDEMASLDEKVRSGRKETVRVMTIQSLMKEKNIDHVDFVKIDTEGFEREVIRGLGGARPSFIQFEFSAHHVHRDCTLHEIVRPLEGYDFYRLLPHGWLKIDPAEYADNIFMYCNIVAVHREARKNTAS